jgi:hypothetical protein
MRAKAMGADRSRFDNQLTAINNCEPQQDVRSLNNLSIAAHSSLFTWRVAFPKIFYTPSGSWSRLLTPLAAFG